MFDWLKTLFASKAVAKDPLWKAMEEMDPLLSYDRFQALELTQQQRPLVKGLIDGTLTPAEIAAVREKMEQHGESDDGIDALVFALQYVFLGTETTYLYEDEMPVPAARFPKYVDENTLTVLFNGRENHLQITSLGEFVSSNNIGAYTLEALDLGQFIGRMTNHTDHTPEETASSEEKRLPVAEGLRQSITIERKADDEGHLEETVGAAEIAAALSNAGFNVTSNEVSLESPLKKLGLFKVPVQLSSDTDSTLYVWLVPSVGP